MFRGTRNFADLAPVWCRRLRMVLVIDLLLLGSVGIALGAAARQQSFPSPEAGVQALLDAAKNNDTPRLLQVLGPEAHPFINTGDAVSDRASRARFVQAYEEAHTLVQAGDTQVILQIGKDTWPFPIPLVKDNTSWRFDSKEGKEEIRNRNIGRNELDVIQVCLAYVDAQREYYRRNPQRLALLQYAAKFMSTKGKRDGLYWATTADEPPSPLGPLLAQARKEGYNPRPANPSLITATIELVASFQEGKHGAPWPSWRPRVVAECGAVRKIRSTPRQRGGENAHDHSMFCSCTPEMYESHRRAFSPYVSRGYADEQNSQPVTYDSLITPVVYAV